MNKTVKRQIDVIFRDITSLGGLSFFIFLLAFLLILQQALFMQLLAGFLLTFAVVVLIRTFYFKHRPARKEYSNYFEKIEASSFPSLHAARIVFLAILFSAYFANQGLAILYTVIAALVSYSRIYLQKHDWWDVAGGVVVGVLTYFITANIF